MKSRIVEQHNIVTVWHGNRVDFWDFWPYRGITSGWTFTGMPSRRFRMSSIERAEALLRLLDLDDAFRAARPNGYAYARVVDVEHATDMPPDALVLAIDPLARLERAYPESPTPETGPPASPLPA
jgi:hypothetical protein